MANIITAGVPQLSRRDALIGTATAALVPAAAPAAPPLELDDPARRMWRAALALLDKKGVTATDPNWPGSVLRCWNRQDIRVCHIQPLPPVTEKQLEGPGEWQRVLVGLTDAMSINIPMPEDTRPLYPHYPYYTMLLAYWNREHLEVLYFQPGPWEAQLPTAV